jgi:hypothetical protein
MTRHRAPSRAPEQAVRLGKLTGHTWHVCDVCGEGMMRSRRAGPRRCVITPGCGGSHRP